jgi:hypothetical protein
MPGRLVFEVIEPERNAEPDVKRVHKSRAVRERDYLARIPNVVIARLKRDVSVKSLVEARGPTRSLEQQDSKVTGPTAARCVAVGAGDEPPEEY